MDKLTIAVVGFVSAIDELNYINNGIVPTSSSRALRIKQILNEAKRAGCGAQVINDTVVVLKRSIAELKGA